MVGNVESDIVNSAAKFAIFSVSIRFDSDSNYSVERAFDMTVKCVLES